MIDKLKNYGEHVQDEAVMTAQLLTDAAALLTEAKGHIEALVKAYEQTLKAYRFSESTDSIIAAREFLWNGKFNS